jgi:Mg2+ and Co2+ transporter CorA
MILFKKIGFGDVVLRKLFVILVAFSMVGCGGTDDAPKAVRKEIVSDKLETIPDLKSSADAKQEDSALDIDANWIDCVQDSLKSESSSGAHSSQDGKDYDRIEVDSKLDSQLENSSEIEKAQEAQYVSVDKTPEKMVEDKFDKLLSDCEQSVAAGTRQKESVWGQKRVIHFKSVPELFDIIQGKGLEVSQAKNMITLRAEDGKLGQVPFSWDLQVEKGDGDQLDFAGWLQVPSGVFEQESQRDELLEYITTGSLSRSGMRIDFRNSRDENKRFSVELPLKYEFSGFGESVIFALPDLSLSSESSDRSHDMVALLNEMFPLKNVLILVGLLDACQELTQGETFGLSVKSSSASAEDNLKLRNLQRAPVDLDLQDFVAKPIGEQIGLVKEQILFYEQQLEVLERKLALFHDPSLALHQKCSKQGAVFNERLNRYKLNHTALLFVDRMMKEQKQGFDVMVASLKNEIAQQKAAFEAKQSLLEAEMQNCKSLSDQLALCNSRVTTLEKSFKNQKEAHERLIKSYKDFVEQALEGSNKLFEEHKGGHGQHRSKISENRKRVADEVRALK